MVLLVLSQKPLLSRFKSKNNNYHSSGFTEANSIAFFILSSNTSAGMSAMPSCSSLRTISLWPPVRPNISRTALGITSCPRSFIMTDPQMFFPVGGGGITFSLSTVVVLIRLSIVIPYRSDSLWHFSISGMVAPFSHFAYACREIPIFSAISSC